MDALIAVGIGLVIYGLLLLGGIALSHFEIDQKLKELKEFGDEPLD